MDMNNLNKNTLKTLNRTEAKLMVLEELMGKFDYLRRVESLMTFTSFELKGEKGEQQVKISEEFGDEVLLVLMKIRDKTKKEIIELERLYFSLI